MASTSRDVLNNDATLSSLKIPETSHKIFCDVFVTKRLLSWNARHILPTVTKWTFSS